MRKGHNCLSIFHIHGGRVPHIVHGRHTILFASSTQIFRSQYCVRTMLWKLNIEFNRIPFQIYVTSIQQFLITDLKYSFYVMKYFVDRCTAKAQEADFLLFAAKKRLLSA